MKIFAAVAAQISKGDKMIRGVKASKIEEKTFKFDGDKLKNKLVYRGNGKAPDKRYDENCEGLSLFIWPSGNKVFYAYKYVQMFNHKKNKLEKNCLYKKMFRYQDVQGYKYRDAKDKLKEALDSLKSPVGKDNSGLLFKDLAKRFLKEGMEGARLDDPDLNYKQSTKTRYIQYVKSILLLKNKDRSRIKDLTKTIIYKNKPSNKPIGDYLCSELTLWHAEVLRERLKDSPTTANSCVQMVSVIFKWAINNDIIQCENPCRNYQWRTANPFKAKLFDEDTAKLKKHVLGKAFDFHPHFITSVGLHLFMGQRSTDIFGLRWEQPSSEEEKNSCSGWLLDGWETAELPSLFFWDMKNRKGAKIHIDRDSLSLLKRLKEANLREKNKWALKSPYVFPQRKDPTKSAVSGSYQKPLAKLNKTLGFEKLEGDNISRVRGKRKIFSWKIARKTFASEVARNKGGTELASRKLNHSSPAITRKSYIVPDDEEMIIENLYEKNLPEKETTVVIKSPWNKKEDIDKE